MNFKIGDKVRFLNETGEGTVSKIINKTTVGITIEDGSNGQLIAEAKLDWLSRDYDHFCWSGQVEGMPFEIVVGGNEGESWADLKTRLRKANDELLIAQKQAELDKLKAAK